MADGNAPTGTPVLGIFTPPAHLADYSFSRGFCVTHDASTEAIATVVAPILMGVATSDARQRVLGARSAGAYSQLLVLAAGDRIDIKGPHMPWVRTAAVTGRRLHAKFGVLQFGNEAGTTFTRAYVTSANLTRPALTSNHEFMCVDECTNKAHTHLVFDLLDAVRHLRDGMTSADAEELSCLRKELRYGLASGGKRTGTVVHSLDKQRDLTHKWSIEVRKKDTASREVTIVSPAFAANSDPVKIPGLDLVLDDTDRVRLVTGVNGDNQPEFSAAAWSQLNERVDSVQLETPAPPDEATQSAARLHSKMLAASISGSRSLALIGSANYSDNGLNGVNRELMVLTHLGPGELEVLLTEIHPIEKDREPVAVKDKEPADLVPLPTNAITARLEMDALARPTQGRWKGVLHLDFEGELPELIRHLHQDLDVTEVQWATIESNAAFLQAHYRDESEPVAIRVEIVPPSGYDEEFWDVPVEEDPGDEDHVLRLLFGDLRRAATAASPPKSGGDREQTATTTQDDRYSIPLQQRLVRLVRHRQLLDVEVPRDSLAAAVRDYLGPDGDAAVAVGLAVVSPDSNDLSGSEQRRLLTALSSAVTSFGSGAEQ